MPSTLSSAHGSHFTKLTCDVYDYFKARSQDGADDAQGPKRMAEQAALVKLHPDGSRVTL